MMARPASPISLNAVAEEGALHFLHSKSQPDIGVPRKGSQYIMYIKKRMGAQMLNWFKVNLSSR